MNIVRSLSLLLAILLWYAAWTYKAPAAVCRFAALDVGQGDAILIQSPDHQDLLIDGGPNQRVVGELSRAMGWANRTLEGVILTHPDTDHAGGLIDVVERWRVGRLLTTGVLAETDTSRTWQATIQERHVPQTFVRAGQQYTFGRWLQVEILAPTESWAGKTYTKKATDGRGGINDTSVVTKISCLGSTVLMTGDASDAVEKELLSQGVDLHVSLLKIGHHGSRYSSDHDFLRAVHPDQAVISVGVHNTYNHPHPAVLERLRVLDIPVIRTDQLGTIRLITNGHGGWRERPLTALDKLREMW